MIKDLDVGEVYSCRFENDAWKEEDWIFVRRPDLRQDIDEGWVQGDGCIENNNPTHTSMVYGKTLGGDLTIESEMSFQDEMAPSIVFATQLNENHKGQLEYQEHFEIVLYNKGVNVWRHRHEDGKSHWTRTAFWEFSLEKDTMYGMSVDVKEKMLTISVADRTFGYTEENLPEECFVGITGQEGVNRFYNFSIYQN